jgi:hypothetical protein
MNGKGMNGKGMNGKGMKGKGMKGEAAPQALNHDTQQIQFSNHFQLFHSLAIPFPCQNPSLIEFIPLLME